MTTKLRQKFNRIPVEISQPHLHKLHRFLKKRGAYSLITDATGISYRSIRKVALTGSGPKRIIDNLSKYIDTLERKGLL